MLCPTLNYCWKELFYIYETEKYKPIYSTSIRPSSLNTCRRRHWKGGAFFQCPTSFKFKFQKDPKKKCEALLKLYLLEQI